MADELTAGDIDFGWSEDAPPGGGVKDELRSLALERMHKQQLINGRVPWTAPPDTVTPR